MRSRERQDSNPGILPSGLKCAHSLLGEQDYVLALKRPYWVALFKLGPKDGPVETALDLGLETLESQCGGQDTALDLGNGASGF